MALGLFGSGQSGDKVLCGSDELRPGQTCSTTQYGQTSDETYEERRQAAVDDANSFQNGGRWVTFGIGTGVAALCGWRLIVALRRRPVQGAGQGTQPPPGQHPGIARQPGFAPWDIRRRRTSRRGRALHSTLDSLRRKVFGNLHHRVTSSSGPGVSGRRGTPAPAGRRVVTTGRVGVPPSRASSPVRTDGPPWCGMPTGYPRSVTRSIRHVVEALLDG